MKKQVLTISLFISAIALMLNSCKKTEVDTETQSATDNSICEAEFNQIAPMVDGFAIKDQGVKKMQSTCYTITVTGDTTTWSSTNPPTMTIDFGVTGCVGNDGKTRKGQVIAKFYKPWHPDTLGTDVLTIDLQNYYVNSIHYEGMMKISKPARFELKTQMTNGKCTGVNNNWVLEWASTRTMKLVIGGGDTDETNDVYELSGDANGVNRNGKKYDIKVKQPLVKKFNCPYIESGIVEITPEGLATRTVDYGTGGCDNKAKLTINGNTFDFTLK